MLNDNSDQSRKKLYYEYEESLFKLVMNDVAEKEGKLFLEQNEMISEEPEYMPTKEALNKFNKRLEAEIKKNIKEQNKYKKVRRFNRAVLVAIIIIITLIIATFGVQAFRSGVFNFLINIQSEFTSFKLEDNKNNIRNERMLVDWENTYAPTYIPNDFEVSSMSNKDNYKKVIFKSKQNEHLYIRYLENSKESMFIAADSEDASLVKTVNINGYYGTLMVKNTTATVAWEMNNKLYTVETNLDKDEAMKIAENVKFIK